MEHANNSLIYVNLFPRSLVERRELGGVLRDHWRTDVVDVCDGGDAVGACCSTRRRCGSSPRDSTVSPSIRLQNS